MKVFISHSKRDRNGTSFVEKIFSGVENTAFFYSYQGPRPPHAQTLKNVITTECNSLIVLLSEYLLSRRFTASWVSYEVGIAHSIGLNVWVFENIEDDPVNMPIPYVSAYVQRKSNLELRSTFPFDTIGDYAGTKIPDLQSEGSAVGSKYFGNITCQNEKCKAHYSIFLVKKEYNCPVCRKKFNAEKLNNIHRVGD